MDSIGVVVFVRVDRARVIALIRVQGILKNNVNRRRPATEASRT